MKKVLGLISLLTIFILLLALSACVPEPEPFLELRVEGTTENIAGGAVNMTQGSQLQLRATLVQDGETVSGAQMGWSIVANTRDATSSLAPPIVGTDVVDGLVKIAPNQPGGLLRLNVTTVHEGRVVSTHVIINVTPSPPLSIELRVEGTTENIAGGAVNMAQGSQLQFRATLVQDGVAVPGARIGWELVSNPRDTVQRNATSPLTTPIIGTDVVGGLVRIASNQPGGLLRLNVTTAHEGRVVNTHIIINVTPPCELQSLENCNAHDTFQDPQTGTWWRVLLPDDGNGNALIITEYVHLLNTRYHSNNGFTLFQSAEASTNLRRWWNNDWTNNGVNMNSPHELNAIGPTLRAMALDYEFQTESGTPIPRTSTAPGAGIEVDRANDSLNSPEGAVSSNTNVQRGHTRPIPNSNATAEPFVLSTSEANHYFSGITGPQGRQTQQFNNTSSDASWWLRSPGHNASTDGSGRHAFVNNGGNIIFAFNATGAWNDEGLRPALWIRQ